MTARHGLRSKSGVEVQSRPEFLTGLRVARYVRSIARSASAADLLAAAESTSRLIAQTSTAVAASRPHGVARVNGTTDNLAIPYWQWEEQNNRRMVELAGINTPPRNPPAVAGAGSNTAGRSSLTNRANEIAYAVKRSFDVAAVAGSPRLGQPSASYNPPVLARIHEIHVYRTHAPAGNLVDVVA